MQDGMSPVGSATFADGSQDLDALLLFWSLLEERRQPLCEH